MLLSAAISLASGPACASRTDGPFAVQGAIEASVLQRTWKRYVGHFVQRDGRVVDPRRGQGTTSEGQAYGMVRAVWIGDQKRFERMRTWTLWNLQGGEAGALPAWHWGPRPDGTWGTIDPSPASDADQLMAWALLLAADRWDQPAYHQQALMMLESIWTQETREINGQRFVLPGPWAMDEDPVVINPSYLLPFAWRAFARAQPERDWAGLIDPSYALLDRLMAGGAQLPPDWVELDPETGEAVGHPDRWPNSEHFGFEAIRVPWNLAADRAWHGEPRATALLAPFEALRLAWRQGGLVTPIMSTELEPISDYEYLGLYGALLPGWGLSAPQDAERLYTQDIAAQWERGRWGDPDDYYSQNWVWFGLALWQLGETPLESTW